MRDKSRKVLKFLISRKLAVWLLITGAVFLIVAITLPPLDSLPKLGRPYYRKFVEIFGMNGVTSSPIFLILPAFVFLSTFLCTIDRIRKKKNKDIGFLGSITFHAGLLTIIIAGVVSMLTLFSGELLLAEGYPTPLGREGFLKIWRDPILMKRELPKGMVTLESYKSVYVGNSPVDHEAKLILEMDGAVRNEVVKVNNPLYLNGFQYTINRYGFSPGFVVQDDKGNTLLDAFINLVIVEGDEDYFEIPETGAKIYVRFFPDFEMTKNGPVSKSRLPNNPVAAVKVKMGNQESKFRLLKKGEKAFVMGYNITFDDLKYWNHFLVNRDKGQPFLVFGVFLLTGGLIVRFVTMINKKERRGVSPS